MTDYLQNRDELRRYRLYLQSEFEKVDNKGGFFSDLWLFLCDSGKWWLLPILIMFLTIAPFYISRGSCAKNK